MILATPRGITRLMDMLLDREVRDAYVFDFGCVCFNLANGFVNINLPDPAFAGFTGHACCF